MPLFQFSSQMGIGLWQSPIFTTSSRIFKSGQIIKRIGLPNGRQAGSDIETSIRTVTANSSPFRLSSILLVAK